MALDGCTYRFFELVTEILPKYMETLLERLEHPWALGPLTERGVGPVTFAKRVGHNHDIMGCYVFAEGARPVYVGISKHVFARVQEHVRGTDHFTATLAYQMAVERHPHGTIATVAIKAVLFKSLKDREVPIYCNSTVTGITEDGSVEIVQCGEKKTLGAFDSVVLAGGMKPVNALATELKGLVANLRTVGDANSVRTVYEALEEGYQAGLQV